MTNRGRILVTGANGFVGRAVLERCISDRIYDVRGTVRRDPGGMPAGARVVRVDDLSPDTNWSRAVVDVQTIVHTAARVHVMRDPSSDPLAEFRRVNVEGTLNLARHAVTSGVRRFIFISSIKVNGERTELGLPFTPDDTPAPVDPYGVSKLEAERALMQLAEESGLEVVIIRPVLVYGAGMKGNMLSLVRLLSRGIPLPLGAIDNKRSLVAVGNLVDFIVTCVDHPASANETFLLSDGDDLSTTELIRVLARAMRRPARLFPIPQSVLMAGAVFLRRGDIARRLLGTLQVDSSKARQLLGWVPPITVDEGLRLAATAL
jgi:nucleoside-diphosphate-sugar epimerase